MRGKGGVEGEVGRFRRNHLVPVPQISSLAALNALIDQWDEEDDTRRVGARPRTVGEYFAAEQPLLKPLPGEPFETGRVFTPRVDRYAQVTVRQCHYSVPVRLTGRRVRVVLGASELVVYDGRAEVARHERVTARYGSRLELDHYLEALVRKPGALPGATVLEQARASGAFTPVHEAWWAAARKAYGDADGTRALIEVLMLHRSMAHQDVLAGITAALSVGALTADAVAVEARKAAEDSGQAEGAAVGSRAVPVPPVTSLTARRLAALPPDTRPLPSVAAYDQLLRRSRQHPAQQRSRTP